MRHQICNDEPADETVGVLPEVVVALTQRAHSKCDDDGNTYGQDERRGEQGDRQGRVESGYSAKLYSVKCNPASWYAVSQGCGN
jgi:hypothetical protein